MSLVRYFERRDFVPSGKIGKPVNSELDFKKAPTFRSC